jgi:hypothetical protein
MEERNVPEVTTPPGSAAGVSPSGSPAAVGEEAELQQFIAANGLREHLEAAVAIARQSFPAGSEVTVRLWHSPEEDDTRVHVHVRLDDGITDASQLFWRLLDRWTRELPLSAQGFLTATYTRS